MLYRDPDMYIRMNEQDRERAMAQRALERAARAGRKPSPGLARGGINLCVGALRRAGAAITRVHPARPEPTSNRRAAPGI